MLGYQIQRHRSEFGELFSRAIFALVSAGSTAIVVLQVKNILGIGRAPGAGPYLFGLLWLLLVASIQFARILFVRRNTGG